MTQAAQCLAKCCVLKLVLPSTARLITCHSLAESVIPRVDAEEEDEENQAVWGHGRHRSGGIGAIAKSIIVPPRRRAARESDA